MEETRLRWCNLVGPQPYADGHGFRSAGVVAAALDLPGLACCFEGLTPYREDCMNTTDISKLPAISDREFAERLQRAQAAASEHGYDMLLVNSNEADFANVRYFSSYWTLFEIAGVAIAPHGDAATNSRLVNDVIPQGKTRFAATITGSTTHR